MYKDFVNFFNKDVKRIDFIVLNALEAMRFLVISLFQSNICRFLSNVVTKAYPFIYSAQIV